MSSPQLLNSRESLANQTRNNKRANIQCEKISGVVVIHLIGRLDILGVQKIERKFNLLTGAQGNSVIVDLSKVELMNSVGLGMIIENANTLKGYNKVMVLLNPQPRVERVIRIAHLDELLPIKFDLEAALLELKRLEAQNQKV